MGLFGKTKTELLLAETRQQLEKMQSDLVAQSELNTKITNEAVAQTKQFTTLLQSYTYNNYPVYPSMDAIRDRNAYIHVDDVYSIVNYLAIKAAGITMRTYKRKAEARAKKAFGDYQDMLSANNIQTSQSLVKSLVLKTMALDELPENDPVVKLLNKPSEILSRQEFYTALYIYLITNGEFFIWKEKLKGGANTGKPFALWIMAPEATAVKVTQFFPQRVVGYQYMVNGQYIDLAAEDVIHVKYFNPMHNCNGREFRGLSPFSAGRKTITRAEAHADAAVGQLQNGGVPSIIWIKDAEGGSGTDAQEILDGHRDNFARFLRNRVAKGSPYFAEGEMGKLELGLALADMEAMEGEKLTFRKLCNLLHVSAKLFNDDSASTYNNIGSDRKAMYTDAILPNVFMVRDALNEQLLKDFPDSKGIDRYIDCDITNVPELQEDMEKMAKVYSQLPVFVPNWIFEAFKMGKSELPEADKLYIKSGYMPIEEAGAGGDVGDIDMTGQRDYGADKE